MSQVSFYKFKLPLLPYTVDILTGKVMIERYAKRYKATAHTGIRAMLDNRSAGCVALGGNLCNYLVLLPEEYDPILVSHESLHLANMMWDRCGARLQSDNDEVIAYTCDYIHEYIKKVCYVSKK